MGSVTLSWRTKPMPPFNWPDNFSTVPLLTRVEGSKCFFKDGSSKKVDAIILCTGYKHHFPFMEERYTLSLCTAVNYIQVYRIVRIFCG